MACPSIEQLLLYVLNLPSNEEAELIRTHLRSDCRLCHQRHELLTEICSLTDNWVLQEPPDWLFRRARALFGRQSEAIDDDGPKRIWGLLVADSLGDEKLLGFRSTGDASRQVLYRAGDYDVDLYIHYDEPRRSVMITGQANPLGGNLDVVSEVEVELLRQSEIVGSTTTNEFGWFYLDETPNGIYNLRIKLRDNELFIPDLDTAEPIQ